MSNLEKNNSHEDEVNEDYILEPVIPILEEDDDDHNTYEKIDEEISLYSLEKNQRLNLQLVHQV